MDVQALLATLMAEREKLTRAIVALEALRGPSALPAAIAKKVPMRKPRRSTRAKIPAATAAAIAVQMRETFDSNGNQMAMARTLGARYGVLPSSIVTGWRGWEKKANGRTVAFTAEETAQATHDPS